MLQAEKAKLKLSSSLFELAREPMHAPVSTHFDIYI